MGASALAIANEAVFRPLEHTSPHATAPSVLSLPVDWETQRETLKSRLQSLHSESTALEALTIARGRSYVRRARAGLLPASAGFDAFAQHLAQLERLRRAIARALRRQDAIVTERLSTANSLKRLETIRPAEKAALAKARNAILASKERDTAFAKAFESPEPLSTPKDTVYGALALPTQAVSASFEARRGQLPFPIAGRTEMTALRSASGSGRALSIECAPGAGVRAVHGGRVAFADDYPGQGKTVLLDHGEHLFSVSSNLQSIAVHLGDEVAEGDRLGRAGFHEGKARLVFELRRGQQTLNTPVWFGL